MRQFFSSVVSVLALLAVLAPPATAGHSVQVTALVVSPEGLTVARERVAAGAAAAQRVAHLQARAEVLAVEVDVPMRLLGTDPLRSHQWGLARLDADAAWDLSDGAATTVAVIDTGVDAAHPDLVGAILPGLDVLDPAGDGTTDPNGHGTHVAGIVSAVVGNGIGVAGLGNGARILPVRTVDADGFALSGDVAAGIVWAADHGADVINLSLGSTSESTVVRSAVDYALAAGVTVVAAAGNAGADGNPTIYPAAQNGVLAVSATNSTDTAPEWSSRGTWVDVAAPGVDIASTVDGGYAYSSGTSQAAPFVAATASLLLTAEPTLTPADVTERVTTTATDLGPSGFDETYGHGLVNPVAALEMVATAEPEPAPEPAPEPEPEPVVEATAISQVGSDEDPVVAAVEISRAAFPSTGEASRVLVARDDSFADSLAGAPLAGSSGPILFTTGGPDAPLRAETAVELARVLEPGGEVVVLGGTAAVSDQAAAAVAALGFSLTRIEGPSRVETAIAVARAVSPDPDRVLLARADDWADAVTGGAYAAAAGVPVLLTGSDTLHPAVADYLAEHDPAVVLLGGQAALGAAVADAVGPHATRVSGPDRSATAAAVAAQLWGRTSASDADHFVVVDGYADGSWLVALAAVSLSASSGAPQLLASADELPSGTTEYLEGLAYRSDRFATAVLVGSRLSDGTAAVLEPLLTGQS